MAPRSRWPDRCDLAGRRRDAADGIGAFDRGMEAGDRNAAAIVARGVAGRIREIQSHPAISRTQSRDEPRAIQNDLLVGMGSSVARTAVGAVFLLPFLYFLWRGWIPKELRARLWMIFGLGAVQGAVGWWMVSSGLTERTSVSQYRLAFHLTLACVIYGGDDVDIAALMEAGKPPAHFHVSALTAIAHRRSWSSSKSISARWSQVLMPG